MSRSSRRDRRFRSLRFEVLEDRHVLATVTVSTPLDVLDGDAFNGIAALIANPGPDNNISLREAIQAANFTSGEDTIDFAPSLNGETITLTQPDDDLVILDSVTINGMDENGVSRNITINGGGGTDGVVGNGNGLSVIVISGSVGTQVEINGLTITGGDRACNSGGIVQDYYAIAA